MKIIYNNLIPFNGFKAINILGFVFVRRDCYFDTVDRTHERIHTAQMKELLYIGFYILYVLEWLFRLCYNPRTAYRQISFEQEAYIHQYNPYYLGDRDKYAWLKYLEKWNK